MGDPNLTLSKVRNPWTDRYKIVHDWIHLWDLGLCQKSQQSLTWGHTHTYVKYNVFVCLLSAFLGSRKAWTDSPAKVNDGWKTCFRCRKCLFGPVNDLRPEGVEYSKNRQNVTRKGEIFSITKSMNNSSNVRDSFKKNYNRLVIKLWSTFV